MSSRHMLILFHQALESAVPVRVVGGVGGPAFPDDLDPDAGEDAYRVGMVVAAVGAVLEQLLPFVLGGGANGKSTLLEAAMHALGRGGYGAAGSM